MNVHPLRSTTRHRAVPPLYPEGIVADRFRIIETIGVGGSATVFEAEDLQNGELVALKAIPAQEKLRKRARREYDVGTLASAAQRKGSSEPWSGTANDDNPIFEEHGLRFRKPARHYLPKRCVGPHCSCPQ